MALATSLQALTGTVAPNIPLPAMDGAGDNSNPYAVIIDRNIFRLNPPPPPVVTEQKPAELPKVNLNGIIKIGEEVRVLFSIPAKDAKSRIAYFKLAPGEMASGEKDDRLELVRIHPDQQEVDVIVNGTAMTLSMLSNSLAATANKAAAPGPGPGARGGPPAAVAAPVAAAAPTGGSSAIVVGGGGSSSPYGGVTVAGGGTVASGGNPASFGGSGGGVTVSGSGGGVSVSGGADAQIATALTAGAPNTGQVGNPIPTHVGSVDQQAAAMIIHNALITSQGGIPPPLPPPVAAAAEALSGPPAPP